MWLHYGAKWKPCLYRASKSCLSKVATFALQIRVFPFKYRQWQQQSIAWSIHLSIIRIVHLVNGLTVDVNEILLSLHLTTLLSELLLANSCLYVAHVSYATLTLCAHRCHNVVWHSLAECVFQCSSPSHGHTCTELHRVGQQ